MGVLSKGTTFADGTQVTSTNLNNLVDDAVFTASAVDDSTTQLSSGKIVVKTVGTGQLATNAVTTAKITDANVTEAKLAADSVSTAKIQDDAVTAAKIADNAINASRVYTGSAFFPIQIIQSAKLDAQTITAGSWTDITDLSLAITRTHTDSKVRVQATVQATTNNAINPIALRIVRESTTIGIPATAGTRTLATATSGYTNARSGGPGTTIDFIDDVSAITTNPLTYKIQAFTSSGVTGYVNQGASDADSDVFVRSISTITLTELA